jgi:Ca2+-binding EF-hand superfamily protein
LHINQLDTCLTLLGHKLNLDELRLFAKECDPDDDEMISIDNFKKSSYKYYESTSFNSFNVTKAVLDYYVREFRNVPNDGKINIEDIRSFLDEFSWHFNDQDIEELLWEVRFLLDDQGETKTKDIASMFRDEIEFFPS